MEAEELAIPMDRINVAEPGEAMNPYDQGTSSSRSTTLMGLTVQTAARDLGRQLKEIGASHFGCGPDAVSLNDGAVSDGRHSMPYSEVIEKHFGLPGGELIGRGMYRGERGGPLGGIAPFWEVAMGGAEVEVERETGIVKLTRYVSVADIGKAINPIQCEAQDEGAAVMGLGHTFFEQMVYEDGQLLNPSLIDYRVPVMSDLPEEFRSILVENGDGPGPYGAKGIGEGAIMPIAPAVANAVADATGARIRDLPLTTERVWRALHKDSD
jgi:CO/xanthine dehydrogenase Mo-binding subunit